MYRLCPMFWGDISIALGTPGKFQWSMSMYYQEGGGHLFHSECLIYPLCTRTRRFTHMYSFTIIQSDVYGYNVPLVASSTRALLVLFSLPPPPLSTLSPITNPSRVRRWGVCGGGGGRGSASTIRLVVTGCASSRATEVTILIINLGNTHSTSCACSSSTASRFVLTQSAVSLNFS